MAKTDLKHIYVVTTIRFGYKYADRERHEDGYYHSYEKRMSPDQKKYLTIVRSRTWGWYERFEDAAKCVENNWGDIYEREYNYALIEKVAEGVLMGVDLPEEHWFQWEGDCDTGGYKPYNKPEEYDCVVCFMDRITGSVRPDVTRAEDSDREIRKEK
jgi:hypothetical protein